MKKLLVIAAIACAAVSANAQVYVGGSLGFWSDKQTTGSTDVKTTTINILPEIGYNISDQWAVGTVIGWEHSKVKDQDAANAFTIAPYARYSFYRNDLVSLFIDGGVGFTSTKVGDADAVSSFNVGFKPGLSVKLSDNFSILAHYGFLGYESYNDDHDAFGLDLNGNSLSFGLYYSF